MITEIRRIIFSRDSIIEILEFGRDKGVLKSIPPGPIEDVDLENPQAPRLKARVNVLGGGKHQTVTLTQSELAALLIVYCRSRKIPLPRQGAKSFEIVREELALVVRHQHQNDNLLRG